MITDKNLSYRKHDLDFKKEKSLEWHEKCFDEYKKNNIFEKNGFKKIIEENQTINIHVDIGSGGGWLLVNTSPLFKRVIGIEPSEAAIEISKHFTSKLNNVVYVNKDMINGYKTTNLTEPSLFTTSVVFSHIDNKTVIDFLNLLNNAPINSVLYFFEPYDKNRHQFLWYVRSKEWWSKNLPDWQLTFHNYTNQNYKYGISGKCIGKKNVINKYNKSIIKILSWHLSGINSRIKYFIKIILNILKYKNKTLP